MLRLQPFKVFNANSIDEILYIFKKHGSNTKLCSGGTDLLPNIKHELLAPKNIVNIKEIKDLKQITVNKNKLTIGSCVTLDEIIQNKFIAQHVPGLKLTATYIASPQIRNMATVGGNICLDTRCLFYNQSYFWREALGFCLKKDGDICHVTKTGIRCVAASSNDLATMLISLDANIDIVGKKEKKTVALKNFYIANGLKNNILKFDEFITNVNISLPPKNLLRLEGFAKLRHRKSIDYPMLSIATSFLVDKSLQIKKARLTINALTAKPKVINCEWLNEKIISNSLIKELAKYATARCQPLINICDDTNWRKKMIAVYVRRACLEALGSEIKID